MPITANDFACLGIKQFLSRRFSADQNIAFRITDGRVVRPPADGERNGHNACAAKIHHDAENAAREGRSHGSQPCCEANRAERGSRFKEEIKEIQALVRLLLDERDADQRRKEHKNRDDGEAE